MSEIDTIRKLHVACDHCDNAANHCDACASQWPCDTRVVLDALDKRWQEWSRAIDFLNKHADDADRLAEHLRDAIHDLIEDWGDDLRWNGTAWVQVAPYPKGQRMNYDAAREALRQHDKEASEPRCDDCCTAAVDGSCRNFNCHKPDTHKKENREHP